MDKLQEILNEFNSKNDSYRATRRKLEERIERAQEQLRKLEKKRPYAIQDILKPLADAICEKCGFKFYEIYGPFGIRGETSIYFANQGKQGNIPICEVETWSLTLEWMYEDNFQINHLLYRTGEKTNLYKQDTIGILNGLDDIYAALPMDLDEIIKLLRHEVK